MTAAFARLFNDGAKAAEHKRQLPEFKKLWKNYPKDVDGRHARPSRDPYAKNQCAIRLSVSLEKSDFDLGSYPDVNKTSEGWARSSKGLADWLWKEVGPPLQISQAEFDLNYGNKQGIIYLAPPSGGIGHIDLWNNGFTGSGYYEATEVWFWPQE